MGDDSSGSLEGKSLSNLRVVDLKLELEKRGLSKSGSKKELVKRLKQKLELEKLYEESASIGAAESKLQLDEATEQNEFVKQYLAEQQKIYARQKEVKRLIELREMGKLDDEEETDSDLGNKDQDSDVSEGQSIAKNSCDSSTHAENTETEPEDVRSASEESESLKDSVVKDSEPESSLQEDLEDIKQAAQDTESRNCEVSPSDEMECKKPDSGVSYSLADIQLPESPKKKMRSVTASKSVSDDHQDESSSEEIVNQDNVVKEDKESSMEGKTNGSPDPDTANNHKEESESPRKDSAREDGKQKRERNGDTSKEEEPMETDDGRTDTVVPANEVSDVIAEEKDSEREDVPPAAEHTAPKVAEEKVEKMEEESVPQDEDQSQDAADSAKPSRKEDLEEGETDSDSEEEKNHVSTQRTNDQTKRFAREDSQESIHSDRSTSSKDARRSRKRSPSSDSSSSRESIPKRKSYSRPVKQLNDSRTDRMRSPVRSQPPINMAEEEEVKLEAPKTSSRRIKIRRSTSIMTPELEPPKIKPEKIESPVDNRPVVAGPVKEIKQETPKRQHKRIVMDKIEDSKPFKQANDSGASTVAKVRLAEPEESSTMKHPIPEAPIDAPPVKVKYRKLNVPFRKTEESKEKQPEKKRSWLNIGSALPGASVSISTDSLKSIIPDFKVTYSPPILPEGEEKTPKLCPEAETPSMNVAPQKTNVESNAAPLKLKSRESKPPEVKKARRESVKEEPEVAAMEVEDVHKRTVLSDKPQSKIVFIRNLVRPFTLLQLKEVLKQNGKVVEEGFWIDKIKSKCFVTYETEEEAAKTREVLNNARWPASNPKILSVEFSTQEEFDVFKCEAERSKPAQLAMPQPAERKEAHIPVVNLSRKDKDEQQQPKERERHRQPLPYVREWDKDKLSQESPEKEFEGRRSPRKREKSVSLERKERKKDVHKKPDEDTPAKLLDDLFQKTKATPCIYWLPLTEEQVKHKEDQRLLRRLEREKRNQEQEEAEKQARRKPRGKDSRSRSRSPARRR